MTFKEYLRICMANLYEKYLGMGKNAITAAEWCTLVDAYEDLTEEEYEV